MLRSVWCVFALWGVSAVIQVGEATSWIGQKVFLKETAKPKAGSQDVDPDLIPFPATVTDEENGWIWVGRAWVKKDEAMLTDQALAYYSNKVKQSPSDSLEWHWRGSVWHSMGKLDNAVHDFNESIRLDPKNEHAYGNRGLAWRDKGELDRAIKDLTEAIRLNPQVHHFYVNRGNVWLRKSDLDNALKDFGEAIRIDPDEAMSYNNRGIVWNKQGQYDKALSDFTEAVRLDPNHVLSLNNIAWLRGTCPDAEYRDGQEAVEYATRVCELSSWANPAWLSTLAAAYAESGDFASAIKWQQKAQTLFPDESRRQWDFLLDLYKAKQPYHEMGNR